MGFDVHDSKDEITHVVPMCVTFITHITYMRKENIYESDININYSSCFFIVRATLKGKNLLPLGANSFLKE